jgi:hypothetical protein
MHFQMGLTYYTRHIVSQAMWPVLNIGWMDSDLACVFKVYLVYLLTSRDTLPSVVFELCSQSSSRIIESDFSVPV